MFAQSYGEITKKSVAQVVPKGTVQAPEEKFKSMAQESFQDMMVQSRKQRPAECFEPGFDTVEFKSEETMKDEYKMMQKQYEQEERAKNP